MPKGIRIFRHLPQIANNQKENCVNLHEPAFHKGRNTMANKYVKNLMTEKMQMKTLMICHFIPIQLVNL